MEMYRIILKDERGKLLWSNTFGWTDSRADADWYTEEEHDTLDLPMGGSWEKIPSSLTNKGPRFCGDEFIEMPNVDKFLQDIYVVCRKHGMSIAIAPDTTHGGFQIVPFTHRDALQLDAACASEDLKLCKTPQ